MKSIAIRLTAILLIAVVSCSCVTQDLWEHTDYREQVFIPADQITEAELQRRGIKYQVVSPETKVDPVTNYRLVQRGGYLVDKSAGQKLRDHAYRALATPITLTMDAAPVAAVVGVVGLYWYHGVAVPVEAVVDAAD